MNFFLFGFFCFVAAAGRVALSLLIMEFTRDVVEYLILNSEDDLKSASSSRFVDTPSAIRRHSYSEMNEKLIEFLDKLAQGYTVSRSNKTEKTEEKKVHRPMAKTKKRRSIHPVTGL